MKEIVYLDVYFAWNFVLDLVSLLLAGQIVSEKAGWFRLFSASAFGAVFSVLILLCSPGRGWTFLLGLLLFFPMIFIAFGKRSFRRFVFVSLFAFLSALFLGGTMEFLSYYAAGTRQGVTLGIFLSALFFAFGAFVLWGKSLKRKMESRVISLSIRKGEREEQLYGLVDSGSFLRDPESGAPVILLKAEYAGSLLSREEMLRFRLGEGEGIVPIPVQTASGRGRLYAFLPEAVHLHRPGKGRRKKEESILVALDFSGGGFAGCPCLIPLSIL